MNIHISHSSRRLVRTGLRFALLVAWVLVFTTRDASAYIDPSAGGMLCAACRLPGSATPAAETVVLLGALLAGDWPLVHAAEPRHQREATGLVAAYLQWHLERGLRSMAYVER